MSPNGGSAAPIRNQTKNELPLILPTTPVASPKKNIRTSQVTAVRPERLAEGPRGRDHGHRPHGDPGHGGHDADHDLEQDVGRDCEDYDGDCLAAETCKGAALPLLDVFAHEPILAEA